MIIEQVLAGVWLACGLVTVVVYLVAVVLPQVRKYAPTAGYLFEFWHFGPRVVMLFVLWPVFAAGFLCHWLEERLRKRG